MWDAEVSQVQLHIGLYAKSSYRGFLVAPYDSVNLDFDHLRHLVPLGAFQRQLRPRRVDGVTQQVARCDAVHSAGSQLPLRVLGMYLCRAPETTRRR